MGRKPLRLERIEDRCKRCTTYRHRRNRLVKKLEEMGTLCNAEICMISYGQSYMRDSAPTLTTFPSSPSRVSATIRRFQNCSRQEREKTTVVPLNFVEDGIRKYSQQLKLKKLENDKMQAELFPSWDPSFDTYDGRQLLQLINDLEIKSRKLQQAIADLKANGAGPSVINNQERQHNSFGGHPNIIDAHASWPSNIMQPMTPGVISANYSLPSQPSIINADAAGTSNLNQQQRQMLMDMDTEGIHLAHYHHGNWPPNYIDRNQQNHINVGFHPPPHNGINADAAGTSDLNYQRRQMLMDAAGIIAHDYAGPSNINCHDGNWPPNYTDRNQQNHINVGFFPPPHNGIHRASDNGINTDAAGTSDLNYQQRQMLMDAAGIIAHDYVGPSNINCHDGNWPPNYIDTNQQHHINVGFHPPPHNGIHHASASYDNGLNTNAAGTSGLNYEQRQILMDAGIIKNNYVGPSD